MLHCFLSDGWAVLQVCCKIAARVLQDVKIQIQTQESKLIWRSADSRADQDSRAGTMAHFSFAATNNRIQSSKKNSRSRNMQEPDLSCCFCLEWRRQSFCFHGNRSCWSCFLISERQKKKSSSRSSSRHSIQSTRQWSRVRHISVQNNTEDSLNNSDMLISHLLCLLWRSER